MKSRLSLSALAAGALLAIGLAGPAAAAGLDLGRYSLSSTFALPTSTASESSAITWNWDSDTLFVLGDEGDHITELSRSGQVLGSMALSGFNDTEALTYTGNGRFVIGEERLQDVYQLSYQAGATVARGSLKSVSLGPTVGNVGLEGISYDRSNGQFVTVKEKSPQAVQFGSIDFDNGTHTMTSLFTPNLGVLDLADVQVLPGSGNLLVFSQESSRLLEVSRSGVVLSSLDFSALSGSTEGVTITADGTIYLTDETPNVYVFSAAPVPEPETYALMLAGLAALAWLTRRHGA
ncbi:SdiA-regulated domain-containing protein [Aquincola tertiaricarbonis]|uniref:SdiA-regulated domain-containing protein n=1 Tax=Aquincola tertiaricarbonis TaxID=391953 RepID=A0ABY4SK95_AQUTE|nr:SdiA-regulated domain-containing protein [Aquincola tertiaricarbonis]URI11579.1 SdiA-regulated domain-containing protein [Aquincola tertiaricarbonis]